MTEQIQINGKTYTLSYKIPKQKHAKPHWSVKITIGKDPESGKQKQHDFTGETPEIVLKKISEYFPGNAMPASDSITVEYVLRQWYDLYHRGWAKTTDSDTIYKIEHTLIPMFGAYPASQLDEITVQNFIYDMRDSGLSRSYIKAHLAILRRSMDYAVYKKIIFCNPCIPVTVPKQGRKKIPPLSSEEAVLILQELINSKYKNIVLCCLICGFRIGECLAISWDDVDFARHTITLSHHYISYDKDGHTEYEYASATKNGNIPTIVLPEIVFDFLLEEKQRQDNYRSQAGIWKNTNNCVFTHKDGRPFHYESVRTAFKKAAKKVGRPDITLHTLRHTAATRGLELTNDLRAVQRLLNHLSLATTMGYIDPSKESELQLAKKEDEYCRDLISKHPELKAVFADCSIPSNI